MLINTIQPFKVTTYPDKKPRVIKKVEKLAKAEKPKNEKEWLA